MYLLKIRFHIVAFIKVLIYKLLFGKKFIIGKKSTFRRNFHVMIEDNGKVQIGSNVFFNNGCSLSSLKLIEIGDHTIFGENVLIYDHNHKFRKSDSSVKEQGYSIEEVKIGKNCWIGSNVVILKGVHIGDNSVIGAGCVVNFDVPNNTILKVDSSCYILEKKKEA